MTNSLDQHSAHEQAVELARELAHHAESTEFRELLFCNNFNLLDILFTPLYLTCLRLVRREPWRPPRWSELRKVVYQLRLRAQEQIASWLAPPVRQAEILFLPYEPTHIAAMLPIANEPRIVSRHAFLAINPHSFFHLRRKGHLPIFADAVWTKELQSLVRALQTKIGRGNGLRAWVTTSTANNTLNSDSCRQAICEVLETHLPFAAKEIVTAQLALQQIKPRIVVVGNDLTVPGRAACRVATQLGISSVCLSHGRITTDTNHKYHIADHFSVYGETQRQTLIASGVERERIEIVGAPYLDTLRPRSPQTHPAIAARLHIPQPAPWVLVAISGAGHLVSLPHHRQTIANLFQACRQHPGVHFIVKLHRKDRPVHYRDCPADIRSRFHIVASGTPRLPQSIFEWFDGCRGVLTGASTAAIEAMLVGLPVITMDFMNELGETDFIQQGATLNVTSSDELIRAVRQVVNNEDALQTTQQRARKFIECEFHRLDGKATERSADVILRLLTSDHESNGERIS